ncbi:hypothetical protein BH10ACT5_BH10ACT5_09840 [soil metagenome]
MTDRLMLLDSASLHSTKDTFSTHVVGKSL